MNRTGRPGVRTAGWLFGALFPILPACGGKGPAPKPPEGREHSGESPAEDHEAEIVLTPKQIENAAIRVEKAASGVVASVLRLTSVVGENVDAQAHVNPKIPGLVRAIGKGLGDQVQANDVLCEIESVELGNAVADYLEEKAALDASREALAKERDLLDRAVRISQRIYDREKDLLEKEITTLRSQYDAEKVLREAELARDRRVLELEREVRQGEIRMEAERDRLRVLGLAPSEIEALAETHGGFGRYAIRAPRDGIVVARHITLSEFVGTETKLFEIQDLSRAWILASVYEKDLATVRTGQRAAVRFDAFPDVRIDGKVSSIGYRVTEASRAVAVRVEIENRPIPGWPEPFPIRPGMFGTVELVVAEETVPVVVPQEAVAQEAGVDYLFVHEGGGRFARRNVAVRAGSGGKVGVLAGVEPGEEIAVSGVFALKSILRQGEIGEGHAH